MAIIPVPQLSDNYAYLVVDDTSLQCGVVDCAEAGKVLAEVDRRGLQLVSVLPTHWHFDHVGGNADLVRAIPGLRVYGARGEHGRIPAQTHPVDHGDLVEVASLKGRVSRPYRLLLRRAECSVYRRHAIHRRMRPRL
jgi:hydroxyacylglutathione hydrolase